jgi:hypothetical protein
MVELLVLLLLDRVARPGPKRGGLVDRLGLAAVRRKLDRHRDVVGVGFDDAAQPDRVEELGGVVPQVQRDRGAAAFALGRLDREAALAVGCPAPGVVAACAPGRDRDRSAARRMNRN